MRWRAAPSAGGARARKPYQRVLLSTDFSSVSRHALETAADWFPEAQGVVQTAQLRTPYGPACVGSSCMGGAGLLLPEHGLNHPADLVVLGTVRRGGVPRLLLGGVAQRIVEQAQNDVLEVPAR